MFEQAGRRTQVMGILNVTEDSFSDGGRYIDFDKAIEHAFALRDAGADLIDVGGESTRPGAVRVPEAVEHARVIPVITELSRAGIVTSVDTMRASVASAAVAAGVSLINDVSGGQADSDMLRVMAEAQVPVCLMHWQTDRFGDASGAHHGEHIIADVRTHLLSLVDAATRAGIDQSRICLDPGLGFAKTADNNWSLLHHLDQIQALGFPLLIGASRKRFLTELGGDRDAATAAVTAIVAHQGVWAVRVHDVAGSAMAVRVAERILSGGRSN
ncbi:MAG: dihydropteroate synthase [Corynebacterium matruchotii]